MHRAFQSGCDMSGLTPCRLSTRFLFQRVLVEVAWSRFKARSRSKVKAVSKHSAWASWARPSFSIRTRLRKCACLHEAENTFVYTTVYTVSQLKMWSEWSDHNVSVSVSWVCSYLYLWLSHLSVKCKQGLLVWYVCLAYSLQQPVIWCCRLQNTVCLGLANLPL